MRRNIPFLCVALLVVGGICNWTRGDAAASDTTILVLPFAAPADANQQWVGRAVQQDLLTDLTQGTSARVLAPANAVPADDTDAAIKAAHDFNASIVVFGHAQSVSGDIRLTGRAIDVASGKSIGAFKATGPSNELFHLEDALAGQLFMAIPKSLLTAQASERMQQMAAHEAAGMPNYGQPTTQPATTIYLQPPDAYTPPTDQYSYPNYTYNNYASPSPDDGYAPQPYDYGYPYSSWDNGLYWGGPLVVVPSFGFHNHFGFRGGRGGRGGFGHVGGFGAGGFHGGSRMSGGAHLGGGGFHAAGGGGRR